MHDLSTHHRAAVPRPARCTRTNYEFGTCHPFETQATHAHRCTRTHARTHGTQTNVLASGGGTADRRIALWNTTSGVCTLEKDTNSQVAPANIAPLAAGRCMALRYSSAGPRELSHGMLVSTGSLCAANVCTRVYAHVNTHRPRWSLHARATDISQSPARHARHLWSPPWRDELSDAAVARAQQIDRNEVANSAPFCYAHVSMHVHAITRVYPGN